jgi:mRNA interferase RelE/StbE
LGWALKFKASVEKDLAEVPAKERRRIVETLERALDGPRQQGKPLTGDKRDLWCYRVGDYRIICDIEDLQLVVLVVRVGHRRDVYKS